MIFNTTRQREFKLSLQNLEMVNDYRYLGVTTDRRLSFIQHVADTKLQIQHDQGHHQSEDWPQHQDAYNPVYVLDKVSSTIRCTRPPFGLQHSLTELRKNTKSTTSLHIRATQQNQSTMIYRKSGILPLRLLIKKEAATHLLRAATKPNQTDIIHRIHEETQTHPRVFNGASWSIKAAWIQKEIGIPSIRPQCPKLVLHD